MVSLERRGGGRSGGLSVFFLESLRARRRCAAVAMQNGLQVSSLSLSSRRRGEPVSMRRARRESTDRTAHYTHQSRRGCKLNAREMKKFIGHGDRKPVLHRTSDLVLRAEGRLFSFSWLRRVPAYASSV
jgi:hypothetical protein